MLPRRHRLTRPADFRGVLRRGPSSGPGQSRRIRRRAGTDLLVVHVALAPSVDGADGPGAADPGSDPPRVGFTVSAAVGNSVVRHRVVRRLRALMAQRLDLLPAGADLVVRALPPAARAPSADLGQALDMALSRTLRVDR